MIKFAFAIPTRNSVKTAKQAIASMAFQSYPHWRAVVVDDGSTDGTANYVMQTAQEFNVYDKFTLLRNEERKWEVANVLAALDRIESDEIVCRLDLDDYLCDLNALEIIAQAYTQITDLDAAWASHRWFDQKGITSQNISKSMPADADPYKFPWVSSHLKTWRKSVSEHICDANYRDASGDYIRRAGDQAIYLPVLKLARRRVHIPIAMYAYRCDMSLETFQTDDAKFQKDEAEFLRHRGFISYDRRSELAYRKLSGESLNDVEIAELNALNEIERSTMPKSDLSEEVRTAIQSVRELRK